MEPPAASPRHPAARQATKQVLPVPTGTSFVGAKSRTRTNSRTNTRTSSVGSTKSDGSSAPPSPRSPRSSQPPSPMASPRGSTSTHHRHHQSIVFSAPPPELTTEFGDDILDEMEVHLQIMEDYDSSRVAAGRAELEVLKQMERFRDYGHAVLSFPGNDRELLNEIFGGDCARICRARVVCETVSFKADANRRDDRRQACLRVCESVEKVLVDLGYAQALHQGLARERMRLADELDRRSTKRWRGISWAVTWLSRWAPTPTSASGAKSPTGPPEADPAPPAPAAPKAADGGAGAQAEQVDSADAPAAPQGGGGDAGKVKAVGANAFSLDWSLGAWTSAPDQRSSTIDTPLLDEAALPAEHHGQACSSSAAPAAAGGGERSCIESSWCEYLALLCVWRSAGGAPRAARCGPQALGGAASARALEDAPCAAGKSEEQLHRPPEPAAAAAGEVELQEQPHRPPEPSGGGSGAAAAGAGEVELQAAPPTSSSSEQLEAAPPSAAADAAPEAAPPSAEGGAHADAKPEAPVTSAAAPAA